ncbi:MAG TPA: EAL domain-containing protein, partial [Desulfosporosinus sp.]|nr:EAL domain-containing protein [Desulfosporosinus sp.]
SFKGFYDQVVLPRVVSTKGGELALENMLIAYAYHRIITDVNNTPIDYEFLEVNSAYERMTGLTQDQIVGRSIVEIQPNIAMDDVNWLEFYGQVALSGEPDVIEHYAQSLNQWFLVHAYSPEKGCFVAYSMDITAIKQRELILKKRNSLLSKSFEQSAASGNKLRKEIEKIRSDRELEQIQIHHEQRTSAIAYRDPLTNLPNKNLFCDRLNTSLATSRRTGAKVVVVLVNLNNFKEINHSWGYSLGDKILVQAANKLVSCMRDYDTVARIGEDRFLLLLQNIKDNDELFPIINRINSVLGQTYNLKGQSIRITASMAISVFPDDGGNSEEILMNFHEPMVKAKDLGKYRYYFYNDPLNQALKQRIKLEKMLNKAIRNHEFELHYQPQYEAKTKRLRGFQALLRWNNPEVGLVMPREFIPLAEQTGLMVPIGKWVINTACQVGVNLNKVYGLNLNMSVNLSPVQIKQKDFYEMVSKSIHKSGIDSFNLELEIPKSVFNEFDKGFSVLKVLKDEGVRMTLTNIGTEDLSISELTKMPINMVKLDREFIHEIDQTRNQSALAESIISMVHKLNIELIASGVETKQQLDYMIKEKCDNIQGYFFEKPVPLELLEGIIHKGILENETLSKVIQQAGLTYESFVKQERQRAGMKWDIKL